MLFFLNEAYQREGRGRVDGTHGVLVVEADVAAGHRGIERSAGLRQSTHRFLQLEEELGVMRIAEIQIIRAAQRSRTGAGQIACAFSHDRLAAFVRIQIDVNTVAIHREGNKFFDSRGDRFRGSIGEHRQAVSLNADHGGIRTGANH